MSRQSNTETFVQKALKIHGNKYQYTKSLYKKAIEKVCIICPEHGDFFITPNNHLRGAGCSICSGNKKLTLESFILKANSIHNNKYNYSNSLLINNTSMLEIICPVHGKFNQKASHHLSGHGCRKCAGTFPKTTEEFITEANLIHENKYNYSLVNYLQSKNSVPIICKTHGTFYQTPDKHLQGQGCYKCNLSKGEHEIKKTLDKLKISYVSQKVFQDCKNPKTNMNLFFDIYLPDYHCCIEYDGRQHVMPIKGWGGEETFKQIQYRDSIKTQYCIENKIILLRIPDSEFKNINLIITKFIDNQRIS